MVADGFHQAQRLERIVVRIKGLKETFPLTFALFVDIPDITLLDMSRVTQHIVN